MVETSQLERQGVDLVLKSKIMGAMPATIYLRPEEVWAALGMVSSGIVLYLPVFIFRGWWRRKMLNR